MPVSLRAAEKFVEKLSKLEGRSRQAGPLSEGKRLWFFSRLGDEDFEIEILSRTSSGQSSVNN
jgi:hypothetical protein